MHAELRIAEISSGSLTGGGYERDLTTVSCPAFTGGRLAEKNDLKTKNSSANRI